jgi:hypothetical protein
MYAVDNRLKAQVPKNVYPLMHFQLTPNVIEESSLEIQSTVLNLFCSQTYQLSLQMTNKGSTAVNRVCVAYDHAELVSFYDTETGVKFDADDYSGCIGVFTSLLGQRTLEPNESLK